MDSLAGHFGSFGGLDPGGRPANTAGALTVAGGAESTGAGLLGAGLLGAGLLGAGLLGAGLGAIG